jgi:DNA-directed RNA polymerase specialized sigma subunit
MMMLWPVTGHIPFLGRVLMAVSPYAEENLRVLHERALDSCRILGECSDATALAVAITKLKAREQVVLALVYFEGFDICEVGSILEMPLHEAIRSHALAVYALIEQLGMRTAEPRCSPTLEVVS